MFVKHHYNYPEEKEPVSEGESGGSSEEHSERHHLHHHHHHYSHQPGLRVIPPNSLISNGGNVSNMESLHGVMSPANNGSIVQYTANTDTAGPFFVPSMSTIGSSGLGSPQDDSSRWISNVLPLFILESSSPHLLSPDVMFWPWSLFVWRYWRHRISRKHKQVWSHIVTVTVSPSAASGPISICKLCPLALTLFTSTSFSSRKREIRLLKNREAARECRRKKKEYIKCLENRVAVLENQNKALIEELKSLKELYTTGESSDTDDVIRVTDNFPGGNKMM